MKYDIELEPIITDDGLLFQLKIAGEFNEDFKTCNEYKFCKVVLRAILKKSNTQLSKIGFLGDVESFTIALSIILAEYQKYSDDVFWEDLTPVEYEIGI